MFCGVWNIVTHVQVDLCMTVMDHTAGTIRTTQKRTLFVR